MFRLPVAHWKFIAVVHAVFLLSGILAAMPWLGLKWIPEDFRYVGRPAVGALAGACAFTILCIYTKCERCGYKLFWHAVSRVAHPSGLNWFLFADDCPQCHHSTRSETRANSLLQSRFTDRQRGFFVANESIAVPMWATATRVHAPALPVAYAQFFDVRVSSAGRSEHHIVVFAHYPRMKPELCDDIGHAIREVCPDAVVSFLLEASEGQAIVRGAPTSEVAYAIALARYTGGWDESDPIRLNIGQAHFQVRLTHSGRVHYGSVKPSTADRVPTADVRGCR